MYKLLIADDEKQTREGLVFFFQNNSCGFEVIGSAEGGLSALNMAGEEEPDVVLTDIRMPDLDGFELIRRMAELKKQPATIIMSAYDDVDYFKTAFKVNAMDYILKPIDTEELLSVMEKVKKRLDTDYEEQKARDLLQKQMKNNLPLLRARFFTDLADGAYKNLKSLEERMDFLHITLDKDIFYIAVMISLDGKQAAYSGANRDAEKALDFGILNLLEELIEVYGDGYAFEYDKGDFVLILKENVLREGEKNSAQKLLLQTEDLIANFLGILRGGTKIRATVGLGEPAYGIKGINTSFLKAKENVCKRIILGSNRVIFNHEFSGYKDNTLFESLNEIRSLVSASDTGGLTKAVETFFHKLSLYPGLTVLYGIQCSSMVIMTVVESYLSLHGNYKTTEEDILKTYEKLGKTETIPDMKQAVINFCLKLNRTIRGKMADQNGDIVHRVKEIIKGKYMENITIQSIAEQIYLSPNYVCAVFKQVTGSTINQYITHVRIEAAKKMLEDTSVRLYDIGFLIGYVEPSYFSKIFKKMTALTPKEYRQMMIGMGKSRAVPEGTGRHKEGVV